jgi:hypothetical protein
MNLYLSKEQHNVYFLPDDVQNDFVERLKKKDKLNCLILDNGSSYLKPLLLK